MPDLFKSRRGRCVREVVDRHEPHPMTLEGVLEAEAWARREADVLVRAR